MYITHEELCDSYDKLEAYAATIPFYKYIHRLETKGSLDALAALIFRVEQRVEEEEMHSFYGDAGYTEYN